MASIYNSILLFFHYYYIAILLCFGCVRSAGFSIPLIPRFAKESPFYQGNLTSTQKLHNLLKLSLPRAYHLYSPQDNIRLPVHQSEHNLYVTKLAMGSPSITQTLILDSGSGMIWTQCKGCTRCFNQTAPLFDPTHSSSYHKFPAVPSICKSNYYKIIHDKCKFNIKYGEGELVSGIVSRDKITFDKVGGGHVEFQHVIFGCATESHKIFFSGGQVSGIVGLNTFRHSLAQQFSTMIQGRFSYCLFEGMDSSSVVKFGEDVIMPSGPHASSVPFVRQKMKDHYYLNLVDISVGKHRIHFQPGTFTLRQDGSRGCVIDSGSVTSHIDEGPYVVVMTNFDHYYTERGLQRLHNLPDEDLEYCYKLDPHFEEYIGMTFHFAKGGGDYVVQWKHMYYFDEEGGYFCVSLFPLKGKTIIGAWQQQNMLIAYDLNHRTLHFKPDHCSN